QELGGLVQVPFRAELAGVRDEDVSDLVQGDLGDIEFVLRDQQQQQVERTLEVLLAHPELRPTLRLLVGLVHRVRRRAGSVVRGHDHATVSSGPSASVGSACAAYSSSLLSLRTRTDSGPEASRSASITATASRTSLPRSTRRSCSARRVSRACSSAISSCCDRYTVILVSCLTRGDPRRGTRRVAPPRSVPRSAVLRKNRSCAAGYRARRLTADAPHGPAADTPRRLRTWEPSW